MPHPALLLLAAVLAVLLAAGCDEAPDRVDAGLRTFLKSAPEPPPFTGH